MLKWLAVVAIFASILPIDVRANTDSSGGNQINSEGAPNPPPLPASAARCEVKQDGSTLECQWTQAKPDGYFKRLFTAQNTPDIALFFVGFVGIIVAIVTLFKLERETKATENQVQASHDGLRAWIGIEVRENVPPPVQLAVTMIDQINNLSIPTPPRFVWKLKNYGQTPAFITKMGSHHVYRDTRMLDTLPIPSMHEIFDFIGAGKEKENVLRIDSFTLRDVIAKSKFWRIIIKIEYLDVFDKEQVHETVASFHYYVPVGGGDPLNAGFYQENDRATNYNT